MSPSRRGTITALGTAGVASAVGALAIGEYVDDDRDRTGPSAAVADVDDETDTDERAAVRIAHLSAATSAVDVAVGGEQLVSELTFDEISPYLQFEPGTHTIQFTAADDPETVLYEEEVTIETAYYTIAVMDDPETTGVEPTVLVDAGAALVRFVHTASDAPSVDVSVRDGRSPLFEDVSPGTATAYAPVPTGSYTLEVAPVTAEPADEQATANSEETAAANESGSEDETASNAETNDASTADTDPDETSSDAGGGSGSGSDSSSDTDTNSNSDSTGSDDDTGAEDEPPAETDDTSDDIDDEDVPDDIDADDVPEDVDEGDVPDDIDPDDIPEDIDEGDIPDDVDADDIPDEFSDAEFDNTSRRVDGELDVSLLSTDQTDAVSIDVSLERGRAYTGYAVDDQQGSDRGLSLTVTVDGESDAAELTIDSGEAY